MSSEDEGRQIVITTYGFLDGIFEFILRKNYSSILQVNIHEKSSDVIGVSTKFPNQCFILIIHLLCGQNWLKNVSIV